MSLLVYLLIFTRIITKVDFFSPEFLIELYKDSPLKHNLINMGEIPYGWSIIGRVVKAEPYDGCQPL